MSTVTKICKFVILLILLFPLAGIADEVGEEVRDVFQTNISAPTQAAPARFDQSPVIQTVLQGIGIGSQDTFTIINGQVYREEEEKQGIKVVKIRRKEVDIIVNGIPSTLRMIPDNNEASQAPAPPVQEQSQPPLPAQGQGGPGAPSVLPPNWPELVKRLKDNL